MSKYIYRVEFTIEGQLYEIYFFSKEVGLDWIKKELKSIIYYQTLKEVEVGKVFKVKK